jgi:predicted GTPase
MHNPDSRPLRVFLCHASQDKQVAHELYTKLQALGMDPWLDEAKLIPGQNWDAAIEAALRASDAIIVCLSNQSVTKTGYVQKEIKRALDLADEQPEDEVFLIPARIEPCEIPRRLSHLHSPEIYSDSGYSRLLEALKIRATKLGRQGSLPTDGLSADRAFSGRDRRGEDWAPFAVSLWGFYPYRQRKSKKGFAVGLVGRVGVGKTSLTYVLTQTDFNFLGMDRSDEGVPYHYRLPFFGSGEDEIHITDHPSYDSDSRSWHLSLDYLEKKVDLILFIVSADDRFGSRDIQVLAQLEGLKETELALVCNRIDLLGDVEAARCLTRLRAASRHIPLPVSAAEGTNLKFLAELIKKASKLCT